MEALLAAILEAIAQGVVAAALPWLQQALTQPKPVIVADPDPTIDQQAQNAINQWDQTH